MKNHPELQNIHYGRKALMHSWLQALLIATLFFLLGAGLFAIAAAPPQRVHPTAGAGDGHAEAPGIAKRFLEFCQSPVTRWLFRLLGILFLAMFLVSGVAGRETPRILIWTV